MSTFKRNLRICSVLGCKNLTHKHQLICDYHQNIGEDKRQYLRENQTVIILGNKSSDVLNTIHEMLSNRIDLSNEKRHENIVELVQYLSLDTGIKEGIIYKYIAEIQNKKDLTNENK